MKLSPTLALLFIFYPSLLYAQAAKEPKVSFEDVLKARYESWTKDLPTGKITADRVNSLVNNPRIHGDDAAAVAALHLYFRAQNNVTSVEESALLQTSKIMDSDERRDQLTKPVNLEQAFSRYRKHIQNAPKELFAKDAPKREGISQGRLGDCFVIAPIGIFVTQHPNRLKGMVDQIIDGSCLVNFPGVKPVRVPKLTEAQIALGSSAGEQGLWLNMMEEACAMELRTLTGKKSAVAMDLISSGGTTAKIIQMLTGHSVESTHLQPADTKERAKVAAEVRRVLTAVHKDKIIACATTSHTKKEDATPGIATGHAYGIVDYNTTTDMVTLWNPWGNKLEPKGPDGIKFGYSTVSGVFSVPLKDFLKLYETLLNQTNKPLPKK